MRGTTPRLLVAETTTAHCSRQDDWLDGCPNSDLHLSLPLRLLRQRGPGGCGVPRSLVVSRQVSVFEVKPFWGDCQDLWSRVLWHPRRPSASYCVELEQYLVHHRYHCNVPRLPTLTKSVIKPTHFAVVADDRPCAHVQRSPHQSPATPDSSMPSLLAAVSGPGRQSHQGGQSLAIPVAQFGKVSHQGCRG